MDQQKIHIEAHVYLTPAQYNYLLAEAQRVNEYAKGRGYDQTFEPKDFISSIVRNAIDIKLANH